MRPSAAVWILLGGVATLACSSGGTSGSGTGGSGGSSGSTAGTTGSAGNGTGGSVGSGGSAGGSTGSGGSAGGTGGSAAGGTGGGAAGSAGTAGSSGTTGAGGGTAGASGTTGRGGAAGTATGGAAGGGTAGAGGRGGAAGSGTGGGAAGRGGAAGSGTGGAGGGGGGAANCSGHAISLSANGTGALAGTSGSDAAYSRVEIDLGSDLPIGNSQRTIEFWAFIKTTDWVGEANEVYFYGSGSGNGNTFGLDFGTNYVMGSTTNHATLNPFTGGSMSFTVDSTADLGINSSTNQWVHIAMVWNGTALIVYVNGLPKITSTGTGGATMLATMSSMLTIGCNPSNMNCFNGLFDEFRVWKVARTATEIMSNYNKQVATDSANLVGYWKFDEASGTTAADAVTAAGHTAHTGMLRATGAVPTFVVPPTPLPLVCN